jgi:hypothetical protein
VFGLLKNCELTNIYEIVNTIVKRKYFNKKNIEEILNAIFYQNAVKVYKLKIN